MRGGSNQVETPKWSGLPSRNRRFGGAPQRGGGNPLRQRIPAKRLDSLQLGFRRDFFHTERRIIGPGVGQLAIVIEIATSEAQHVVALSRHQKTLDDLIGCACALLETRVRRLFLVS